MLSREDQELAPAAYVHVVDIGDSQPHFHKRTTELYYVLEGRGVMVLDGTRHKIRKGSLIQIPPRVVHGALGKLRVLVMGIPRIADEDYFAVAGDTQRKPRSLRKTRAAS